MRARTFPPRRQRDDEREDFRPRFTRADASSEQSTPWAHDPFAGPLLSFAGSRRISVRVDEAARRRGRPCIWLGAFVGGMFLGIGRNFANCEEALDWLRAGVAPEGSR